MQKPPKAELHKLEKQHEQIIPRGMVADRHTFGISVTPETESPKIFLGHKIESRTNYCGGYCGGNSS